MADVQQDSGIEWTAEMEVTLFQAIARFKPVGVHRFFRIISVQRFFNQNMGTKIAVDQLWERLSLFYNLARLDAVSDSHADEDKAIPFEAQDFTLPYEDFEDLIEERRRAETPTEGKTPVKPSPSPDKPVAAPETPAARPKGRPRKYPRKEEAVQSSPATVPASQQSHAQATTAVSAQSTPTSVRRSTRSVGPTSTPSTAPASARKKKK